MYCTWLETETFRPSWGLGVLVYGLLNGLINRNSSKWIARSNLNGEPTIPEVLRGIWVLLGEICHVVVACTQVAGIVMLAMCEAPWYRVVDG